MPTTPDSPQAGQAGKSASSSDVSNDLEARPEDIDKVKGGARKRLEDPCQGGESPVRP
ncbi:MAG: hypothetical protein ABI664_07490 [bacterium]